MFGLFSQFAETSTTAIGQRFDTLAGLPGFDASFEAVFCLFPQQSRRPFGLRLRSCPYLSEEFRE
jgi:hypothetical protein